MIDFIIREFDELSTGELYEMLQFRSAVFVVEQNCAYQDMDDKDQLCFHLLGYHQHKLVAYARLIPEGVSYENYCSIGRVAVSQSVRHQLYGKLLMSRAIDFCKEKFSFYIKISAQAYLEKFYQDHGFITVSEPYLEDNIPHIAMVRK